MLGGVLISLRKGLPFRREVQPFKEPHDTNLCDDMLYNWTPAAADHFEGTLAVE